MTTDELIRALRELALNVNTELLNAAARRPGCDPLDGESQFAGGNAK